MDRRLGFFYGKNQQRKDLEMTAIVLGILGILLGAAGMQFLRSSKPELVEKAENSIKRLWDSMPFTKSDD